jgi:predicted amidohydrolase
VSRPVSIAACNFAIRPVGGFDEFAEHVRGLLDQCEGADIVLFPELFTLELLSTLEGWQDAPISEIARLTAFSDAYRELFAGEAQRRGQHILAGSHLVEEQGQRLNVAYLYGPDGLVHTHAKTHIFPAEGEWDTVEGDDARVVDLPFARVGIAICYEAEIPEYVSSLVHQGAEIVLCPSYTFSEAGFWRVRHCANARAIENQIYFVHCCTTGDKHADVLPGGWGRSSILSPCDAPWPAPNGVVAEAPDTGEHVVRGTVDLDLLDENRENGAATTFRDRRRRASLYARLPSHLTDAAKS